VCCSEASAQETVPLSKAIDCLQTMGSNIPPFEYEGTYQSVQEPNEKLGLQRQVSTGHIKYFSSNNKWFFTVNWGDKVYGPVAFNGTVTQSIDTVPPGAKRLVIKNGEFKTDPMMGWYNFFYEPFYFIALSQLDKDSEYGLKASDLSSKELWSKLAKTAVGVSTKTIRGHNCIVIKLTGANSMLNNESYDVTVYLASDLGYYPIRSEKNYARLKTKIIKDVYDFGTFNVEGVGALPLYYPKKQVETMFTDDVLTETATKTITQFKIGSIDDNQFTIDPSSVDMILDADKKLIIDVPR